MTGFQDHFGPAEVLRLERTFRSPQSICDISSAFVSKNRAQLTKHVQSQQPEFPTPLQAVAVRQRTQYDSVIGEYLQALDNDIQADRTLPGRGGHATVYILGRYNNMRADVSSVLGRQWRHLDVAFSTIHSAKGREAATSSSRAPSPAACPAPSRTTRSSRWPCPPVTPSGSPRNADCSTWR